MSIMRYLYGKTDEKHVRLDYKENKEKLKPLDTYRFKLNPLLEGKPKIKPGEASIRYKATPDTLVELCSPVVNAIQLPQPFQWTALEVADWIRKLGFPQYQNTFRKNYINGRTLLRMDASNLPKINIRDMDHIRIITYSIRKLYKFDKSSFSRSISLPDRTPDALYKFFRIRNGTKYDKTRRTDLFRRLHLLRPPPLYETHWQTLERWLKHLRPIETELIGGTSQKKYNLFYPPKAKLIVIVEKKDPLVLDCDCMPPCTYIWKKEIHLRERWKLKCLSDAAYLSIRRDDCACIDACTCGPKVSYQKGITLLKVHIPEKYAVTEDRMSIDHSIKVRFSHR